MMILAEIADKMPSTSAIVVTGIVAATVSVAIASAHRGMAWGVFVLALTGGVFVAFVGYHESFVEGPFSDVVWSELGWPWVAASIVAPLAPVIAVTAFMVLRRRPLAR